jgi:D-glycero-alpha-D-manno-heptose-7-phosphate kinase
MQIAAKAPCRVDLAGGTLDIWPLYLFHAQPVTVNFAVNIYARCTVKPREDARIILESRDLGAAQAFESLEELRASTDVRLPLLARALEYFAPEHGVEIETESDAPAGAGISGSSALLIALCTVLNKLTGRNYKLEKLREISQNIEARVIRVPTGSQDYYPAMYGGVSAVELNVDGIRWLPIPLDPAELDARFLLSYTGAPRNSGINNWEVMKAHIDGNAAVQRNFDLIAAIANQMRHALAIQDWTEVGRLLREEWTHRRENAPGISTPLIDRLVCVTRQAGATGAKVCGAGGGGCVLFLTEPDARERVRDAILQEGAMVLPAQVATRGVTWLP